MPALSWAAVSSAQHKYCKCHKVFKAPSRIGLNIPFPSGLESQMSPCSTYFKDPTVESPWCHACQAWIVVIFNNYQIVVRIFYLPFTDKAGIDFCDSHLHSSRSWSMMYRIPRSLSVSSPSDPISTRIFKLTRCLYGISKLSYLSFWSE